MDGWGVGWRSKLFLAVAGSTSSCIREENFHSKLLHETGVAMRVGTGDGTINKKANLSTHTEISNCFGNFSGTKPNPEAK